MSVKLSFRTCKSQSLWNSLPKSKYPGRFPAGKIPKKRRPCGIILIQLRKKDRKLEKWESRLPTEYMVGQRHFMMAEPDLQ